MLVVEDTVVVFAGRIEGCCVLARGRIGGSALVAVVDDCPAVLTFPDNGTRTGPCVGP